MAVLLGPWPPSGLNVGSVCVVSPDPPEIYLLAWLDLFRLVLEFLDLLLGVLAGLGSVCFDLYALLADMLPSPPLSILR